MSMSQSKLMIQLNKQLKISQKIVFSEQKLQELYGNICKIEPKNLMLVQFLSLMIQKNLIKNSYKLTTFVEMFEQIKGKKLQQQNSGFNKNANGQKQQQKFNKKKFLKLLKDIGKLLYPGDQKSYQSILYSKLILSDSQQSRMKVDENLKKYLSQEVICSLNNYQKELQILFQVFMPQNYNLKLEFSWGQLSLLQKRLPMICLLRILFQAQICPQVISQLQFLEILNKMIPPCNSNHKEVMFFYSQTFNNYMREYIFADQIKIIEGDVGVTFLEFQMLIVRIATQYSKDNKLQFTKYIDKLMNQFAITQLVKSKKQPLKSTKLQKTISNYLKDFEKPAGKPNLKKDNLIKKQRQQINDLIDSNQNSSSKLPSLIKTIQYQSLLVTKDDMIQIKKSLDDQLGPIPQKPKIDKENEGYFNVNEKYIVVGQQLPKIIQKNKASPKANPKQGKQDPFLGFKPEQQVDQSQKPGSLLNRKKKLRVNTQYPVILNQVFYPSSFKSSQLPLKQSQQVYLQTTYIHLGQRLYQEAYGNFQKARAIYQHDKITKNQKKSVAIQYYFALLQAQIFQAAGKDHAALSLYYTAKELTYSLLSTQVEAKAFSYLGLSSSLYHLQEYEFSLRCLFKAKQVYGQALVTQSIQNAILLNNIASCYMMLNRNQQAVKYFNISHQILDLKAGRFDQRTLIVQQNVSKNKKAYIEQMPSFKTMWKTFVSKNNKLSTVKPSKKAK